MSFSIRRIFASVAMAGLASAGASYAGVKGTFHLPVTAHLGMAVLAPGDYQIRVQDLSTGAKQVTVEGKGHTFYAMPVAIDPRSAAGSSLQLVQLKGDYFVQQFRSDVTGKTYSFRVPKASRAMSATMSIN